MQLVQFVGDGIDAFQTNFRESVKFLNFVKSSFRKTQFN